MLFRSFRGILGLSPAEELISFLDRNLSRICIIVFIVKLVPEILISRFRYIPSAVSVEVDVNSLTFPCGVYGRIFRNLRILIKVSGIGINIFLACIPSVKVIAFPCRLFVREFRSYRFWAFQ